jgi:Tfp pilus assembly protein PilX
MRKYYLNHLQNESGVALVTGLVIMVLLTAIGTYAIHVTEIDQTIAGNLKASKQAFYLADAGLQWGKAHVRNSTAIPPETVGSSFTQTLGSGTMTISFLAQDPAGIAMQYTVAIRATGTIGQATRTVDALVTKTYALSDAPIALRGVEANSGFTGNAFEIDGHDYFYNPATNGWQMSSTVSFGVSVPNATLQTQVVNALSSQQQDNIMGQGGTPSVGISTSFPSDAITSLANALCDATPAGSQTTINLSQTLPMNGNTTWGNRTAPQIHCVTGSGTASKPATLDIGGNFSGAGILVVRNAQLVASGAFHYEGLIINSGSDVGVKIHGGGNKEIYGAVMINELNHDTQLEVEAQGAVKVRASSSALAMASQLFSWQAWQTLLPVAPIGVQERSWREVSQ